MEDSTLIFSSLDLMRALVICSVKARFSVLVWGSLDILCTKLITSERVQLSKSMSLLSKVVVVSSKLTCLKASMCMGVSSSMVEVIASPLIGPMEIGVCWVLQVWVSSMTWIVAIVWCRKALNSMFFHGDNFWFGCHLIYQSRLGVRHV